MPKSKNLKIDFEKEFNFFLLGIVSYEADIRLCWLVNQNLQIQLSRQEDLEWKHLKSGEQFFFPKYSFEDSENQINYSLIANRYQGHFFIEEFKNFDYFLKISGDIPSAKMNQYRIALRNTEGIQMIHVFNPADLKSKHKLLF